MLRYRARAKLRNTIFFCTFVIIACYGASKIQSKIKDSTYVRGKSYVIESKVDMSFIKSREQNMEFLDNPDYKRLKFFDGGGMDRRPFGLVEIDHPTDKNKDSDKVNYKNSDSGISKFEINDHLAGPIPLVGKTLFSIKHSKYYEPLQYQPPIYNKEGQANTLINDQYLQNMIHTNNVTENQPNNMTMPEMGYNIDSFEENAASSESEDKMKQIEFPITAKEAVDMFEKELNSWEQQEILNYTQIWFLGLDANKTEVHQNSSDNYGMDYSDGKMKNHYKVVAHDHIAYRYEILTKLGSGMQGTTVEVIDHSNNQKVAIKISKNSRFGHQHSDQEVKLLQYIQEHATNLGYFPRMIDFFTFRNHSCMVMELMGSGIDDHLKIEDPKLLQQFIRDILHAMFYLHEINVFHSDFKSHNVMYIRGKNNRSEGQLLKLVDFGLACIPGSVGDFICRDYYFQPRLYRSPESILCLLPVTTRSDMFGVGVLMAEFILGVPPMVGRNETEQLATMMEVLGPPPQYIIDKAQRKYIYREALKLYFKKGFLGDYFNIHITKSLRGVHPLLFDLIMRCLEWDPNLRLTARDALQHPYLNIQFMATRR